MWRGSRARDSLYTSFVSDFHCFRLEEFDAGAHDRMAGQLHDAIPTYVLAELGAAWGQDTPTFPLLVRGAKHEHVPSPLNERKSLSLEKESDRLQLVENVARATTLKSRTNVLARIRYAGAGACPTLP